MKQTIIKIAFTLLGVVLLINCKKDNSVEGNGINVNSKGTLLDSSGSCQSIVAKGNYIFESTLTDSNFISVQVNIVTSGKYLISTDTINGFWFIDSGYVFNTGTQTIKVRGHGKPLLPVNTTFIVSYNNAYCFFVVPIFGATGGTIPAFGTYSLSGSPDTCFGAVVQGTYTNRQLLTSANTAVIQVSVTSPGGYSISTSIVNGMTFKRNGIFNTIGSQAVTLYGTGTPIDSGTAIIPVSAGSSMCIFPVKVK